MKQITIFFIASVLLLGLANCDKETTEPNEPAPSPELMLISENYALGAGLMIQYYSYEDPFVGYNKIYLAVRDSVSGEKLNEEIDLSIIPMMDMDMMTHSCPTEDLEYNPDSKLYKGAATYVMPSTAGTWVLNVNVHGVGLGDLATSIIGLEVVELEEAKLVSFQSAIDPDATYFVSLVQPKDPKVGENDFEILINRRASMMDWPYEPYLTVEIEPEMPSMNHGSPNNVNPTHIGMGHYQGVVNFTMTGWWKVNMIIKDGEGVVLSDDIAFDITF